MGLLSLRRYFTAFVVLLFCAAAPAACSSSSADSSGAPSTPAPPDDTPIDDDEVVRALAEADIVQAAGGRLYAMSRLGHVSIVDISIPGRLTLLGRIRLPGEPFEMYRRGDQLIAMTNGAYSHNGALREPVAHSSYYPRPTDGGAAVVVLDVNDPAQPRVADSYPVPGEIADSRLVGDILYLVTYENATCWNCGTKPSTLLTSFDLSDRTQLRPIDQLGFNAGPTPGYDAFNATPWKRSIFVTKDRLYLGGMADSPSPDYPDGLGYGEGLLEVVDVSDPTGQLVRGATLPIAGPILSRWQMDERDGILRVVSQRGAGSSQNGTGMPMVETFKVESADLFARLGRTQLRLPIQEGLRAVRFDEKRAYAITYRTSDPLFVIDLADPAHPKQRGELYMPGFIFHMQPRGDQVLGLGIDGNDPGGNLNLSLIDVQDLDHPTLVQRVPFGPRYGATSTITSQVVPEDQDRIQKAFRIIGDGKSTDLVVVPFSAPTPYAQGSNLCNGASGGVQLVDWTPGSSLPLTKRASLPLRGHPRRALANGSELLTISESNVRSFSLANHDEAYQTADLEIETCSAYYDDEAFCGGMFGCSLSPTRLVNGAPWWGYGITAALACLGILRRRRRLSAS